MVSRNNIKYKVQQDAKCVPHYGIRKLSIGVASVLLGTVFYMQNGIVHADVNPSVSTGSDSVNVVNKDSGTSGLPVEGATKQVNNSVLAASEPKSATPASQVNAGIDNSNAISSLPPASHHQAINQNVLVANSSTGLQEQDQQSLFTNNNAINTLGMSTDSQNQRFAGLQQSLVQQDSNNVVTSVDTVQSHTLSGLYGSTIQSTSALSTDLQALLASGKYDLVSNPLTSLPKYSTMNNPITISLKHHIDSTQRHYRVIEDLPDGTKKVIIDVEATLYKDANEKYYSEWGANLNGTGKILKSNEYRILSGQVMGSLSNNSDIVSAVDMIPGYTATFVDPIPMYQDGVHAVLMDDGRARVDVFNGSGAHNDPASGSCAINPLSSRDFHIIYTRRSYPVTVNYYDIDGKLVNSVTSTYKFGDTVSIAPVAPTNYVLVSGQAKTDYLMRSGLNEVDFLVEPKLTTTAETKMVSRTIKVQTPDGQTNNVVQTVTFVRNGYLNQVTKQTTYSPWSFGGQYQFSGYQPKLMAGYTADLVSAVIVTPDSLSTTVNVVYHKIPVVYSIDYQLTNGTVVKNVSATPGRDGTIHLTAPQGYRLLTTVTDVQVGRSSQKLTVLVLPDEQIYTAYSTLPSSVTEPLTKTITRTINITMPNGRVRKVIQQVHFVRTATVAADGKITYSNWTGVGQTSFDRLFVPKRRGYQLVMTDKQGQTLTGVNQMLVDPTMDDAVINVKYVK